MTTYTSRMALRIFAPPASLAAFVEAFWIEDGENHEGGARSLVQQRELPNGIPLLAINLSKGESLRVYHPGALRCGDSFPEAFLRGPHSEWYQYEESPALVQVGVRFRPGGASPFFAPPSSELHNRHVPLDALWGARATTELRERLLEAPGPEEQVRLLARTLQAEAVRPLELHPAVAFALHACHASYASDAPLACTIAEVADEVGMSHARFIQVFRAAVGLTPKRYWRVRRFQEVLRRACGRERDTWTQIALECGYYDQAHLNHDFRALAGTTPDAHARDMRE